MIATDLEPLDKVVRALRASGVTIILTTHYIEEAEEMADRIGVINDGKIILVEDKAELLVAFNQPATSQHPFMYHCHILEHEDAGMMGQYVCG